jgi:hypothetical protein
MDAPTGLGAAGRTLWAEITAEHELDPMQRVTLEEACRAKDRLDKLNEILRGEADVWCHLVEDANEPATYTLKVSAALTQSNATANLMKQLLAALRLPDAAGKRPQQRGGARGSYAPSAPSGDGKVSSLERARARKGA